MPTVGSLPGNQSPDNDAARCQAPLRERDHQA